jgi:hypothetical protein
MPENNSNFWLEDKIALLNQFIGQIASDIKSRRSLNKMFLKHLNQEIRDTEFQLKEIKSWQLGNNASIESRRIHLEKELTQLKRQKREWLTDSWKDIQSLRKELRQHEGELRSLQRIKSAYLNNNENGAGPQADVWKE